MTENELDLATDDHNTGRYGLDQHGRRWPESCSADELFGDERAWREYVRREVLGLK